MHTVCIGIGGIGSHLAPWVARFLAHEESRHMLTLVDKDALEVKNLVRQNFDGEEFGNKAELAARELMRSFAASLDIRHMNAYVTPDNAGAIIPEGSIVLLCVDNHRTRKIVSDHASTRKDVCVISGGNALDYGTVLCMERRNGQVSKPALTANHPEIAHPVDRAPYEMGCEELARSGATQIHAVNVLVAAWMYAAYYRRMTDPEGFTHKLVGRAPHLRHTEYDEIWFDLDGNAAPKRHGGE